MGAKTCKSPEEARASCGYNSGMRQKSRIDQEKQRERIERARRMTPENRLLACVNISRLVAEFQRAGQQYREEAFKKSRR